MCQKDGVRDPVTFVESILAFFHNLRQERLEPVGEDFGEDAVENVTEGNGTVVFYVCKHLLLRHKTDEGAVGLS